jgi:hypothetical protein
LLKVERSSPKGLICWDMWAQGGKRTICREAELRRRPDPHCQPGACHLASRAIRKRERRPSHGITYQVIPDAIPQDVELHQAQLPITITLGSH